MTTKTQLLALQTRNLWSMDRLASELNVETAALRWWLADAPPQGRMTWAVLKGVELAAERVVVAQDAQDPPKPLRTLADEYAIRHGRMATNQQFSELMEVLHGRGLRSSEIGRLCGFPGNRINNVRKFLSHAKPHEVFELARLAELTIDLTGKERVSRKPSVPHPMLEELAARMELNRLIEEANAREVAA